MNKLFASIAIVAAFAASAAVAQTPSPFTPAEEKAFVETYNAGGPNGGAIFTDAGQVKSPDFSGIDEKAFEKTFNSAGPNGGAVYYPSYFTPEDGRLFDEIYNGGGPNGGAIHN